MPNFMNKTKINMQIVENHWNLKAIENLDYRKLINWMEYPLIQREYINIRYSNNLNNNWLDYVKNKYLPKKLSRGLSLGCGSGGLERHGLAINICDYFDAFDYSKDSIKLAEKLSLEQGTIDHINYKACDINKISLEKNKYDVVFASMSVHHFFELEWIFSQVKFSLKKNGYFILNEYVGPNQFQWTDKQLNIANNILEILPTRLKKSISNPDISKNKIIRLSKEEMNLLDPSEAIRSEDIYKCLKTYFTVIEEDHYGGTILHLLLNDIVGNFNLNSEEDCSIIKLLCLYEEDLIKNSILSSDFMLLICKNE